MLHLTGRLAYGETTVFAEVDFRLTAGERVVLLGRSGSGKTTLLNAAHAGLAASLPVALVPQETGLVPQLSVFHNVYMGRLDARGALYNLANLIWPLPRERQRVEAVLALVGMQGLGRRPVGALSGGQKQRTALARGLHRGGPVLMGDEPVSAVDERHGAALIGLLAQRFPTLLLALHDVALARSVATRIVGIRAGRITLDQPAAQVSDAQLQALYRA